MKKILNEILLLVFITGFTACIFPWIVPAASFEGVIGYLPDNSIMVSSNYFHSPSEEYSDQIGLVLTDIIFNQKLTVTNCTDVIISNVTVIYESIAILITDSINVSVINCYAANGIRVINSVDVTIDRCTVVDSVEHYASIYAESSEYITDEKTTVTCGFIEMENSSELIISSNTFTTSTIDTSNHNKVIIDKCLNTAVVNNTLITGSDGIDIKYSISTTVSNNTVNAKGAFKCIWLYKLSNVSATANTLYGASHGFEIERCNLTYIANNTVYQTLTGIYLWYSWDSNIKNNNLESSSNGLITISINTCNITDNII
ncbi:MAG: NosD domain-containing protein, partial [Candidatus Hodarchaeales archaeon]